LLESEDEASLQKLLEGMMDQLMSKEVLFEPLKELNDKVCSFSPCSVLYLLMAPSLVPILSRFKRGQAFGVRPSTIRGATRVRLKNYCRI
jgi:hypothetical protein